MGFSFILTFVKTLWFQVSGWKWLLWPNINVLTLPRRSQNKDKPKQQLYWCKHEIPSFKELKSCNSFAGSIQNKPEIITHCTQALNCARLNGDEQNHYNIYIQNECFHLKVHGSRVYTRYQTFLHLFLLQHWSFISVCNQNWKNRLYELDSKRHAMSTKWSWNYPCYTTFKDFETFWV